MTSTFKILLTAGVLLSALGATALSFNSRQQPAMSIAEEKAHPISIVGPTKDDPLKADASWVRWRSLTDF